MATGSHARVVSSNIELNGDRKFVNEDYGAAIKCYSDAIMNSPNRSEIRLSRAAALLKVGDTVGAIEDCNYCLSLEELESYHALAYYRKGVALFCEGNFASSKNCLCAGQASAKHKPEYDYLETTWDMWIGKCDLELLDVSDREEVPLFLRNEDPSRSSIMKDVLRLQPDIAPAKEPNTLRHEWSQSSNRLYLVFYCKGVRDNGCRVVCSTPFSIIVTLSITGFSEPYHFEATSLGGEINTKDITVNISPLKVEIVLIKKIEGLWRHILGKDILASQVDGYYPTSNKTKRNWDNIEKECEAEIRNDIKSNGGEEALNMLFKEIYSKGDEETRRAMIKSFQTSGGTVLSTNWNDVGKKDYEKEIQAPAGQEVKKWES